MCKYCDDENTWTILFRKGKEKIIGCIFNLRYYDIGPVLGIKGKDKDDPNDWYDFRINYCPRCGKQLRKELIPEYRIKNRVKGDNYGKR